MNHFLEISQLSRLQIESLLDKAFLFKKDRAFPDYSAHTVANLFYEPSTRTRVSFEMAANHLSMHVVNLDLSHSSENKGEIIEDTFSNLAAMDIEYFVIRHSQDGLPQKLADTLGDSISVINAGDGAHAHPSQALLDMMTIIEEKSDLSKLKIAIIG